MKVVLGWPDYGINATFSAGSWEANLPLTQLNRPLLAAVARSTDDTAANTVIDIDLGSVLNVGLIALCNHNLSAAATWRIYAYDESGHITETFDSASMPVWIDFYSSLELEWEDDNFWTGGSSGNAGFPNTALFLVPNLGHVQRYWRIEPTDELNLDGYVQIGRVIMAKAFRPTRQPQVGGQVGHYTETAATSGINGTLAFDERPRLRETRITLSYNNASDSRILFDIAGASGLHDDVFFIFDEDADFDFYRFSWLGRFTEVTPLEYITYNRTSKALAIREIT